MDSKARRRFVLLGAVIVTLAVAVTYRLRSPSGTPTTRPSTESAASKPATPESRAPRIALDALAADRPEPGDGERNPFRFQPKAPPPPPAGPPGSKPETGGTTGGGSQTAAPPAPPAGPPPPPPIALKFIGTLEGRGGIGKIAVLSDARAVYYGREGDIVDGRYRIVRIGVESIELEYVDGRGRQTIRFTGS